MAANEESLFLTSLTPLKLTVNGQEIWVNPKPSSPHFTRPVHLQYKRETKELTLSKEQSLRQEIDMLNDYALDTVNGNMSGNIEFKAEITMLDGKAVNAITDTRSTQSCNVCGATPKEMNDLAKIRAKTVKED